MGKYADGCGGLPHSVGEMAASPPEGDGGCYPAVLHGAMEKYGRRVAK